MGDAGPISFLPLLPLPSFIESQTGSAGTQSINYLPWIVQKFGGTSLGHFASSIVDSIIIPASLAGYRVAVVCSAFSRGSKDKGTTTRLLQACAEVCACSTEYKGLVRTVEEEHIQTAEQEIGPSEYLDGLVEKIHSECAAAIRTLDAAYMLGEVSTVCLGRVVSTGEKLSCYHLTALLESRGCPATCVDATELHKDTPTQRARSYQGGRSELAGGLARLVNRAHGIPVVTGYFGFTTGTGLLDTVGRGYTDLCAALLAVGVKAKELQIWKEVDGVFTADPRRVPNAQLLPALSVTEARDLTFYGSEVVHCAAVDIAAEHQLSIRIKNVANPAGVGTVITPDTSATHKDLMAITAKRPVAFLTVRCRQHASSLSKYSQVFSILQSWGLTADLVTAGQTELSLAVSAPVPLSIPVDKTSSGNDSVMLPHSTQLWGAIDSMKQLCGTVKISTNMAIICVVWRPASTLNCAATTILSVLNEKGIQTPMIEQGASESSVACVIHEKHVSSAIKALHDRLWQLSGKETGQV